LLTIADCPFTVAAKEIFVQQSTNQFSWGQVLALYRGSLIQWRVHPHIAQSSSCVLRYLMNLVHRIWVRHNFNLKRVALTSGIRGSDCDGCGKMVTSKSRKREIK
jgi:hypothetical protein